MQDNERIEYIKHRKIIGIDPGKAGGIAVYSVDVGRAVEVAAMPVTPQDLLHLLRMYQYNSVCYLERVQGMPGNSGSAMFNFGVGYGQLQMALLAVKIPTITVTPQRWQKELQLGHKGQQTTAQWKNKLRQKAEQLFPYIEHITLSTADALLIMQYGIIQERL